MFYAHNGPIHRYLTATGNTIQQFEQALKEGLPSAVALFGSEVVFQRLDSLVAEVLNECDVKSGSEKEQSPGDTGSFR